MRLFFLRPNKNLDVRVETMREEPVCSLLPHYMIPTPSFATSDLAYFSNPRSVPNLFV